MRVAVIGGGPSGLVTLKYLLAAHASLRIDCIEARLFESDSNIGGTFFSRTYEDAELVSSKQLTTFSDFRPRDDDPDFLSAERYLEYLHDYCTYFDLWPHIHLSTKVLSVTRREGGGHILTYLIKDRQEEGRWECDAIAVCSGLHVVPNIPQVRGIEKIPRVMHSSEFKRRRDFTIDKTVLLLGSGETGADISYLAVTSPTKRVVTCHRDGFHFAPKRNLDPVILPILGNKQKARLTVPLDCSRASLFDTAYVHPFLRNHSALWVFYDIYVKCALWITTGSAKGLDQWVGGISPQRDHVSKIFFNKSNKACPYISAPYRTEGMSSIIQRIRSSIVQAPIPDTSGRQIDLAPWPERIDNNGVIQFQDNGRPEYRRMKDEKIKPDIAIFCTGYTQEFPFLGGPKSRSSRSYPTPADANVRSIWKCDDPTIGFIGFVRPSLGAIPPISEMQAQLWVLNLALRIPRPLLPEDEPHYKLHPPESSRIHYGVDHESYIYQLALDMDSAPGALEIVQIGWTHASKDWWKLPLYALDLTQSVNSFSLKAAVLIGTVCEVTDHEKKWSALENIGDVLPLQWENARRVRDYEYKMMRALRVAIDLDKSHMHASGPSWNRMRG
ncbi:uncharacterized protein ATNIH1004_009514 [Aspergillus tanneri]|uniref:FAD/NAD(P)-binding domain-containing protein n=1 Tax=Aspergillus tanneri TaxID=1220188 RepID=A0A5M9M6U2_9EURO|nr:uncharacterized protein ATNIH1004_009514 [Aspergillus tanneri]KAA8642762.1 hypothetical protein ATNIH1004_009514 [Aspergillus tanneri]